MVFLDKIWGIEFIFRCRGGSEIRPYKFIGRTTYLRG
jgi:hypothetical protein